jgi:hypothetical protein
MSIVTVNANEFHCRNKAANFTAEGYLGIWLPYMCRYPLQGRLFIFDSIIKSRGCEGSPTLHGSVLALCLLSGS